jgi:hypothetical protein
MQPPWDVGQSRIDYIQPVDGPLPGFSATRRVRPRSDRSGRYRARWRDDEGRSYEWDYRHGSVEMYSRRGEHLGEFDPIIGRRLKPRDPVMVEQYPILRRLLDLAKNVAHV